MPDLQKALATGQERVKDEVHQPGGVHAVCGSSLVPTCGADRAQLFPTLRSVMSQPLEISPDGSIYTTEISKGYKPAPCAPTPAPSSSAVTHFPAHQRVHLISESSSP